MGEEGAEVGMFHAESQDALLTRVFVGVAAAVPFHSLQCP